VLFILIKRASVFAALLLCCQSVFAAKNVALLLDGPEVRPFVSRDALQAEVLSLTRDEFDVQMPAELQVDGNWTQTGVSAALDKLLADPDVDIIIALGALSSQEAARRESLAKPVVATMVVDQELQGFPYTDGRSGKRNLSYITNVQSLDDDLLLFKDAVRFSHVAILVDAGILAGLDDFSREKSAQLSKMLEAPLTPVPVAGSLTLAIQQLPDAVDAVFVTPLLRFSEADIAALSDELIARKLPSFSTYGVTELNNGLLLATGGRPEDEVRLVRRIALNVQRILLGDQPANIPVAIQESRRLAINMRTAKAINYAPRFALLSDAEQLFADEGGDATPFTLLEAMQRAAETNLQLKVASSEPLLAGEETRLARSDLLPQFRVEAGAAQIDEDRAVLGFQSEKSSDLEVGGSQLIYGDDAWASYRIRSYLEVAENERYRGALLDILQASGRSYLNVLRLQAFEDVQRSNLEVTRTNLELARVRESIGYSGRSDVLRWESEIATARQELINATANRRQAEDQLLQLLNLTGGQQVRPDDASVEKTLAMFTQPKFQALIDNATTWETFQDYVVLKGIEQSPEVAQVDQQLLAGQRSVTAAQRRYWLPEFKLEGFVGRNLNRSGAGSDSIVQDANERSWQVGVNARLPVFNGGALRADLNRQRYSLRQAQDQREFTVQDTETRVRIALEQVASSYSAIDLTAEAARAARENLNITIDAYSKGARSVTDLIDAQNNALFAELSAAQAKYVYLGDVINVLRESGDFGLMLDPQTMNEWYQEVEAFFNERGVKLVY